ncbi:hypothetical protein ACTXT7_007713 [Hymenolepis weldensis]
MAAKDDITPKPEILAKMRYNFVFAAARHQSCLGVMIGTYLGIYLQTHKCRAGPPVDIVVEILSPPTSNRQWTR